MDAILHIPFNKQGANIVEPEPMDLNCVVPRRFTTVGMSALLIILPSNSRSWMRAGKLHNRIGNRRKGV